MRLLGNTIEASMRDRAAQEAIVRRSGLSWTLVKPPRLTNGPRTDRVQCGSDVRAGLLSSVSRQDLAQLLLDLCTDDKSDERIVRVVERFEPRDADVFWLRLERWFEDARAPLLETRRRHRHFHNFGLFHPMRNDNEHVLSFARHRQDGHVLVLANFSEHPQSFRGDLPFHAGLVGVVTVLLAPGIQRDPVLARMGWAARVGFSTVRRAPWLSGLVLERMLAPFLSGLSGSAQTVEALRTLHAPDADLFVLADTGIRDTLNAAVADAVRDGGRGAGQDLALYSRDWGIPLDTIEPPIAVWHGAADAIVPVGHTHWYEKNLPKVRVNVLPSEGHFSLPVRHAGAILNDLLSCSICDAAPCPG